MPGPPNAPPNPPNLPSAKTGLPAKAPTYETLGQLGPGQRQQRQRLADEQARALAARQQQQALGAGSANQEVARSALHHAVRATAQQRIKSQALAAAPFSREEIWNFCEWILDKEPENGEASLQAGKLSVPGIKSEKRAAEKVAWDYGSFGTGDPKRQAIRGDWYGVKDIARMTVVLRDDAQCLLALQKLRTVFAPQHGRSVLVEKIVDPQKNESGYSGYTAFVRTSNGWPAEIQINVATIIYAKENEQVARNVLGESEFNRIKMFYGLPCGLGHELYEHSRKPGANPAMAQKARDASKDYYAYFRGSAPNPVLKQKVLTAMRDLELGSH